MLFLCIRNSDILVIYKDNMSSGYNLNIDKSLRDKMRIQIIGASGSGKTTLGKRLAELNGIWFIDTDSYLWKDDRYTINYSVEERLQMIEKDLQTHNDYIVSGSVFSYNKKGFTNKELTIFLTLDEALRQERLHKREIQRYGEYAFDSFDELGKPTNDFLEWTKTYWPEKDEAKVGTYLAHQKELSRLKTPWITVDGNLPLEAKVQLIMEFYKQNISK